jgi:fumarate hydratase subunit beta
MTAKKISLPLQDEIILSLRAGDRVLISGTLYTARDAAHKRMAESISRGEELPFDITNQVIYYVGPTPAKPEQIIGSAGPTTSGRVDKYTPVLLERGLKGMIGKGSRNQEVRNAIQQHGAVYFGAIGGSGALIARTIKEVEIVAYEDLGTEAIRKLTVVDFPAIVINDQFGNDWYEQAVQTFRDPDSEVN